MSLPDEERRALAAEVAAHGLEIDPLVAGDWPPCWGLNIAVGWPLPVEVAAYERFAAELAALDPGLFVYPHAQSHVTVMTLVSFKHHPHPTPDEAAAFEALAARVAARLAPVARSLRPFVLAPEAPVLSRRAVFVPMRDPARTIAQLRAEARAALAGIEGLGELSAPPAVHSTVARFRALPSPDFPARFAIWARARMLPSLTIDAVLVTTETRPYMREGRIVARLAL